MARYALIHAIAHAPVPPNDAALTPVTELNGPYILVSAGLAVIATMRLQADVVDGPIDHDTQPLLLIGVTRPSHTHLFSEPTTQAAAPKIDAEFGTMIAICHSYTASVNRSRSIG